MSPKPTPRPRPKRAKCPKHKVNLVNGTCPVCRVAKGR